MVIIPNQLDSAPKLILKQYKNVKIALLILSQSYSCDPKQPQSDINFRLLND